MLKINRSELDKAIGNLSNMFAATEEVLKDYESDKQVLEERGDVLNASIAELQQLHAKTMSERDDAKNSPKDYVRMSKQLSTMDDEMKVFVSLKDKLKDDFKELKQKYVPIIRETYSKDTAVKSQFNVNDTVDYVRYELLKAISDYASELNKKDTEIMPIIYDEFLDDTELMENNKSFKRSFDFGRNRLSYSDVSKSVISKNNVDLACGGNIAPEIPKPKDVE